MFDLNRYQKIYNIGSGLVLTIGLAPIVIPLLYAVLLWSPYTDRWAVEMLRENRPVQLLTFGALLWAGIQGLLLAKKAKSEGEGTLVTGFYFLFSCALIFTAMEEISWGQTFFHFSTPSTLLAINAQREFSLHNIRGLQGQAEILRGIFGLGGIIGVGLSARAGFKKICPSDILLPWFLIILAFAFLDFYVELYSINSIFSWFVLRLAEVIELLVGFSAVLFIWLNQRKLKIVWEKSS